ncbi:hypothetical protein TNCV_4440941 [Trichonephila clavipes]|nr:hypothetical protein TNCV_4440941 [Trichonephila clavipes]
MSTTDRSLRRPPHCTKHKRTANASSAAIQEQGRLHVLHLTPTHRLLRFEWCCARGNCSEAEWNQIFFRLMSFRFNLSSEDNHVRV